MQILIFRIFLLWMRKNPWKMPISLLEQVSDHLGETRMLLSVFKDTGDTVDSLLEIVQKTPG